LILNYLGSSMLAIALEQFQQKCEAVLRPELRKNKEIERFRDSKKSGNALVFVAAVNRVALALIP
jgi:hypothetical protein